MTVIGFVRGADGTAGRVELQSSRRGGRAIAEHRLRNSGDGAGFGAALAAEGRAKGQGRTGGEGQKGQNKRRVAAMVLPSRVADRYIPRRPRRTVGCPSLSNCRQIGTIPWSARRRSDQAEPINDRASAGPTTRSWRSPPTSSRSDWSIPPTFTGSKPAVRINRSTSSAARSSSVT